ncbi:MAG: glycosyltransferase [Janthinobacterium lividum]
MSTITSSSNEISEVTLTAGRGLAPDDGVWREVHRVVFPAGQDVDVLPLYVDFSQSEGYTSEDDDEITFVSTGTDQDTEAASSRRSLVVPAKRRYSLGTYFNAFPASYWRRWTRAESIRFSGSFSGTGTVVMYKSNARAMRQRVASWSVDGDTVIQEELTLASFADGGWYWFDVVGGADKLVVHQASWAAPLADREAGTATVNVTTFNRPDYCVKLLQTLADDATAMDAIDRINIVDQGTRKVRDEDGYEAAAAALGDRLRIIDQPNLGGSGGFARGMYETLKAGTSRYALLLDDDVNVEPEGIVRAIQFGDACRSATIVGGHMFDMYDRATLHSPGEAVNLYRFMWGPVRSLPESHNFAARNMRQTSWFHRRVDVDYNGWWMCLIPVEVIEELGLSLPVFIKWDDSEYGLRAQKAGYPTVSLPGACVWHVPWSEKDDRIDWQAYYHQRNRFLAALLYSPYERGGNLFRESAQVDVMHLISMQYYAAALRVKALKDILAGPEHLHRTLATSLPEVRGLRAQFPDAQVQTEPDAFPAPKRDKPPHKGKQPKAPRRELLVPWAAKAIAKQLRPVKAGAEEHPEVTLAAMDGRWWELSLYDSATVSTADGKGAVWYRRDPKKFRALLAESVALHARLLTEWPRLRKEYREAREQFTSPEAWEKTFGISSAGETNPQA